MKRRRRHALVEVSSDEASSSSSSSDFAPTKLKPKRISIVLNKKQLASPQLQCARSFRPPQECTAELKICNSAVSKFSRKQRSGRPVIEIKINTQGMSRKQTEGAAHIRGGAPQPEVPLETSGCPASSASKPTSHATKQSLELSDSDDSLLLVPVSSKSNGLESNSALTDVSDSIKTDIHQSPEGVQIELSLTGEHSSASASPKHQIVSDVENNLLLTNNSEMILSLESTTDVQIQSNISDLPVLKNPNTILPDTIPATNDETIVIIPTSSLSKTPSQKGRHSPNQRSRKLSHSSPSTRSTGDTLGYSFCQICQKNITSYNAEKRRSHVNRCCDGLERANNFGAPEDSPTEAREGSPTEAREGSLTEAPEGSANHRSPDRTTTSADANSTPTASFISVSTEPPISIPDEPISKPTINISADNSTCLLCQKTFRDQCALKRHLKACCRSHGLCYDVVWEMYSRASENESESSIIQTSCPLCSKTFVNQRNLKRHVKTCSEKNGKSFETVWELKLADGATVTKTDSSGKGRPKKEKKVPVLLLDSKGAVNRAQNRILDAISNQEQVDISSTPALKTSNLTTYRSKKNPIWNLAGNNNNSLQTVLSHENSRSNTQPPAQYEIPAVDQSISVDRSALPSQADITQLTQFLQDLGRDNNMKERLSTLIQSPLKLRNDCDEIVVKCEGSPVDDKTRGAEFVELVNHITINPHSSDSRRSIQKSNETMPVSEITIDNEIDITKQKNNDGDLQDCKTEDRSPNPSEISAVGNSSFVRTPAGNISEIVSSIHGEDGEGSPRGTSHTHSLVHEDSNMDLFTDETEPRVGETVEFDRSLLNVSPITDHGLAEEDHPSGLKNGDDITDQNGMVTSRERKRLDSTRESSPIYQPKVCSSTTREAEASVQTAYFHKIVQVSSETRNKSSEALVSHRIGSTNTPIVDTKTCATQAENLSKSCAETQADGERSLCSMMLRLKAHSTSSDVTITCTDTSQKQAHRIILEVACPRFLSSLKEGCSGQAVDIGISSSAADLFLEFVYTQQIEKGSIESEVLKELYNAADRYEMKGLTHHLHGKGIETVEIKLQRDQGGTLLLNLSTQEVLNLSEQLGFVSSQFPDNVPALGETFAVEDGSADEMCPDFPSFQEHSFINNWGEINRVDSPPNSSMLGDVPADSSISSDLQPNNSVSCDVKQTAGDGTSIRETLDAPESDLDDLPCTGLLALDKTNSLNVLSEADRRASQLIQLIQDVEFIDLVNNLDDIVVSTPLSILDTLDSSTREEVPQTGLLRYPTTPSSSLNLDADLSNISSFSESISLKPSYSGVKRNITKKATSRKSVRKSAASTPDQSSNVSANLSAYQKTPAFKSMDTPRLKSEVQRFGMKALTKKKAVAKLEEIHRFTNKKFLKCPSQGSDDEVVIPNNKKKVERSLKSSNSRKRKVSDESSGSDKECPVGDITMQEKLPKTALKDVSVLVKEAIQAEEHLYCKILQYEPIDIIVIKGLIKRKTSVGLIAQVLDNQGITYFNSETKAKGFKGKGNPVKRTKT